MPNTLCHFAVQGPTNRLISKKLPILWIFTGCILPDIPWIIQRILLPLHLFNPYDVRLYVTVQASLVFCVLLSLVLALFTEKTFHVFILLAANCLFHLLLDTIEVKWGNGVQLFAPISWKMLQFNLFNSDSLLFTAGTVIGLIFVVVVWKKAASEQTWLIRPSCVKAGIALGCLAIYALAPLHYMNYLEKANIRYIHTLRDMSARSGKFIEFDRVPFSAAKHNIKTFTGEKIILKGNIPKESGLLSLQGRFVNAKIIDVKNSHIDGKLRAWGSYIGISLFALLWLQAIYLKSRSAVKESPG